MVVPFIIMVRLMLCICGSYGVTLRMFVRWKCKGVLISAKKSCRRGLFCIRFSLLLVTVMYLTYFISCSVFKHKIVLNAFSTGIEKSMLRNGRTWYVMRINSIMPMEPYWGEQIWRK